MHPPFEVSTRFLWQFSKDGELGFRAISCLVVLGDGGIRLGKIRTVSLCRFENIG